MRGFTADRRQSSMQHPCDKATLCPLCCLLYVTGWRVTDRLDRSIEPHALDAVSVACQLFK